MEDLQDEIINALTPNFEDSKFLADQSLLSGILNRDKIVRVLRNKVKPENILGITKAIEYGSQKVFSILILIGRPEYMVELLTNDYLQHGGLDRKLPFELTFLKEKMALKHADRFWDEQWTFCVPTLFESALFRVLPSKAILPFLRLSYKESNGSFGEMAEVELDAEHHQFDVFPTQTVTASSKRRVTLVQKSLSLSDHPMDSNDSNAHSKNGHINPEIERELENLALLKSVRHSNIIGLIACFTYRKKFHFLFPVARGGNLGEFLEKDRPKQFNTNSSVVVALTGLASALSCMHLYFAADTSISMLGCHHDLKPDNVLVDGDKFILADFGLSHFRDPHAGSSTTFQPVNGYFQAPEAQELLGDMKRNKVGRSSDMWSFGCLVAVVVTHMLRGHDGVKQFEEQRKFRLANWTYYYFHQGTQPNPKVFEWLSESQTMCANYETLLVDLIRDLLEMDPCKRPGAKSVHGRLQFISLCIMADEVLQKWATASQQTPSLDTTFDLVIEKERFTGWLVSVGAIEHYLSHSPTKTWQIAAVDDFDSSVRILRLMIAEFPAPDAHPRDRFIFRLRQLNTQLFALLSSQAQKNAENYLQAEFMATRSCPLLWKLRDGLAGERLESISRVQVAKHQAERERAETEYDGKADAACLVGQRDFQPNITIGLFKDGNTNLNVLVEWKKYDHKARGDRLSPRIYSIFKQFNTVSYDGNSPGVLRCHRWFHDEDRNSFGLVYEFPRTSTTGTEHSTPVTSLRTLLGGSCPDLAARYDLAHKITQSLWNCHQVEWLHKRFSSYSIIFFPQPSEENTALSQPFIIGFMHSRPDKNQVFTEGPPLDSAQKDYCHPEYLRYDKKFRQYYDIYSLGLVLMEIGHWKPLKDMVPKNGSPEDLRDYMLAKLVPRLRQRVGVRFEKVVRICLQGKYDENTGSGRHADLGSTNAPGMAANEMDPSDFIEEGLTMVSKHSRLAFQQQVLKPLLELATYEI